MPLSLYVQPPQGEPDLQTGCPLFDGGEILDGFNVHVLHGRDGKSFRLDVAERHIEMADRVDRDPIETAVGTTHVGIQLQIPGLDVSG